MEVKMWSPSVTPLVSHRSHGNHHLALPPHPHEDPFPPDPVPYPHGSLTIQGPKQNLQFFQTRSLNWSHFSSTFSSLNVFTPGKEPQIKPICPTALIGLTIKLTISSVSGRQLGVHGHIDTIHLAVTYNEGSLMYIEGARHNGFNAFTQLKFHMT